MIKTCSRIAAILVLGVLLTACGSKLNQDNFNKITNGMPYAEVVKILGEPASSQGGGALGFTASTATWQDSKAQITVVFLNEKVQTKSFSNTPPAGNNNP